MGKKRKTRQEKIILQLKRELAKEKKKIASRGTKSTISQEAISPLPQIEPQKISRPKRADDSIFSYDPRLIKKDLVKTLILAALALSLEFMLYLRLG